MLKIAGTYNKPSIEFNTETGALLIEGQSFTVNAIEFYKPLLYAIADYKKNPQPRTIVHFKLDYINTSSSKSILDVLHELELLNECSEVIINWYYENTDTGMLEAGKSYSAMVSLTFILIAVEPDKRQLSGFFNTHQRGRHL